MARTKRDTIKDKRAQIYGKIDKIVEYLHAIYVLSVDDAPEYVEIAEAARDLTAIYAESLQALLENL